MNTFTNKNIVITGGASGIGKIMARLFLQRKANVILWDINPYLLENTVKELSPLGSIEGFIIDVTDLHRIQTLSKEVLNKYKAIDVLINNAGIVVGKLFQDHTLDDITKTMDINANAPMYITHCFLPSMIERKKGHICTIASSAGLVSNPKMSVYAASKWSVVGWSDSLRIEMMQNKTNINVTTIMPYYINTGMFDGVQSRIPILDPEKAALSIVTAIEKNKRMVTLPNYIYRFTRLGQGFLSLSLFDWFAGKVLGIYKTMEHFTGHKK